MLITETFPVLPTPELVRRSWTPLTPLSTSVPKRFRLTNGRGSSGTLLTDPATWLAVLAQAYRGWQVHSSQIASGVIERPCAPYQVVIRLPRCTEPSHYVVLFTTRTALAGSQGVPLILRPDRMHRFSVPRSDRDVGAQASNWDIPRGQAGAFRGSLPPRATKPGLASCGNDRSCTERPKPSLHHSKLSVHP